MRSDLSLGLKVAIGALIFLTGISFWAQAAENILDMDLSSLMEIQITSAGRKEQALSDVPAAVYVIDREKLERSGATCIPEALRMVPGLQVARINANHWAISARGFNGTFSNKLLVQIDGRSVYSPSYSGVYWDMQNVMIDDIDRIEVIRGPGATLWGANAVNGVINIITREASQTQGGLVSLGTGTHERQMASARMGIKLNQDTYARIYAMHNDRDEFTNAESGAGGKDDWKNTQAGFRMDGDRGTRDSWTLQGDIYQGESSQDVLIHMIPDPPYNDPVVDKVDLSGGNLLGRWTHKAGGAGTWTAQAYYDYSSRDEVFLEQTHHTLDLDLQHRIRPTDRHDVVWGLGYRTIKGDYDNTFQVTTGHDSLTSHLFSGFAQDEITLKEDAVWLTLGAKIEHNDFSGVEFQPNARLLWKPGNRHSLWASVSQASRTPGRMENSGRIVQTVVPPPYYTEYTLNGHSDYDSEKLTAWESGYRYSPGPGFFLDFALFYNQYKDCLSYVSDLSRGNVQYFMNGLEGEGYGAEISILWSPIQWMETEISYTWLTLDMEGDEYSRRTFEEGSPSHQASFRTGFDLGKNIHLNIWARYTGSVEFPSFQDFSKTRAVVDGYFTLDANIKWKLSKSLDLIVAGQNLLDGEHLEYVSEGYISNVEIERSAYAKLTWRF